jgi:homoserine kinase
MPVATVTVPATTANLGPGFDCIGAALSLHNQFRFTPLSPESPKVQFQVKGTEADRVQQDENNLVYQAFCRVYNHLKQTPPPVKIEIQLGVPLARGLGSSATAIVGGLLGANLLAGSPLDRDEIMELAIAMEGHPDNVVPALVGGCQLSARDAQNHWLTVPIPWHPDIVPVIAIPNFELSTAEARRVLPTEYSRADAIFNTAHLGLLVRALETGNAKWLQAALLDRIHQPYRETLITGYEAVQAAALSVGAYGLVISGAGPTLLALTSAERSPAVQARMERAWAEQGILAQVEALQLDTEGAIAQLQASE